MTPEEALKIVVEHHGGNTRFMYLCSDDNPEIQQRQLCRDYVMKTAAKLAGSEPVAWAPLDKPLEYPSVMEQAGNLVRAGWDFAKSGFQIASQEEQDRRLAICHECDLWDARRERCSKCGCIGTYKAWVAASHCPIDKW